MRPIVTTVDANSTKDVILDLYTSYQAVNWNINGGTVAVHGLVGPLDGLVEETTALTGNTLQGTAYTALRFKNTNTTDAAALVINQVGAAGN